MPDEVTCATTDADAPPPDAVYWGGRLFG